MPYWNGNSTLFVFWFGINDIIVSNTTPENTVNIGLTVTYNTVLDLYKRGASNFLFINVPPFDLSPWGFSINDPYISNSINIFNIGINSMTSQLPSDFPYANIFQYNAMDEFNYLLENHELVGINNINDVAIDDENSNSMRVIEHYFWYNHLHPSTSVHRYLATDIHEFLNKYSINKVQPSTTHEKALANFDRINSYFPIEYMTTPTTLILEDQNSNENNSTSYTLNSNSKPNSESGSTLKYHNTINSSYFALSIFLFYFLFF